LSSQIDIRLPENQSVFKPSKLRMRINEVK
jgi:hypothetical protein